MTKAQIDALIAAAEAEAISYEAVINQVLGEWWEPNPHVPRQDPINNAETLHSRFSRVLAKHQQQYVDALRVGGRHLQTHINQINWLADYVSGLQEVVVQ